MPYLRAALRISLSLAEPAALVKTDAVIASTISAIFLPTNYLLSGSIIGVSEVNRLPGVSDWRNSCVFQPTRPRLGVVAEITPRKCREFFVGAASKKASDVREIAD